MSAPANINPTLTAAQNAGNGSKASATGQLLKALSKNERDSELGLLAHALLMGGDYLAKHAEDMEANHIYADEIRCRSEAIAEEYERDADYHMQPLN